MTNPMTTRQMPRNRAVHQSDDVEVARALTTQCAWVYADLAEEDWQRLSAGPGSLAAFRRARGLAGG